MTLTCMWGTEPVDWQAMAAWAQAVISGLAIYFAVKAVDRQHRLEQQREREQHRLELKRERDRDRAARLGRLGAVEAELKSCAEQCEVYTVTSREGPMLAPAYRLPLVAYNSVLSRCSWPMAFCRRTLRGQLASTTSTRFPSIGV